MHLKTYLDGERKRRKTLGMDWITWTLCPFYFIGDWGKEQGKSSDGKRWQTDKITSSRINRSCPVWVLIVKKRTLMAFISLISRPTEWRWWIHRSAWDVNDDQQLPQLFPNKNKTKTAPPRGGESFRNSGVLFVGVVSMLLLFFL